MFTDTNSNSNANILLSVSGLVGVLSQSFNKEYVLQPVFGIRFRVYCSGFRVLRTIIGFPGLFSKGIDRNLIETF